MTAPNLAADPAYAEEVLGVELNRDLWLWLSRQPEAQGEDILELYELYRGLVAAGAELFVPWREDQA